MPVDLPALVADLEAETDDLLALLAPLGPPDWDRPTPAEGWLIRDQVSHLAFFDDAAVQALVDPDGFRTAAAEVMGRGPDFPDQVAADARTLDATAVHRWFVGAREALVASFVDADPSARLPWFGPDMSSASSVTARLMETWAHGQDVADALGVERTPTARLRHIAHLGVATRAHSYRLRRRDVPASPVRVEVDAPDGTLWAWGEPDAGERVTGPALDLCLVVTQRRHHEDTALVATEGARDWLGIAQAFAGAPGRGRRR
ncbi:TIGR03084 family protein [Iamia sp. SCSIO 61187]|uniref:TIGR03084 family metal-binding protein n=1 Tax=Iamia sp. SCSIO 61187 TaxID=2722752 RepID=UPI001C629F48|nr:TIGR03084 family metal-binding protein [Iamia sp. SCSIO 61187]QYG93814.1 TIGR03084 family protein [Iamia sp. SCSIO 61187]